MYITVFYIKTTYSSCVIIVTVVLHISASVLVFVWWVLKTEFQQRMTHSIWHSFWKGIWPSILNIYGLLFPYPSIWRCSNSIGIRILSTEVLLKFKFRGFFINKHFRMVMFKFYTKMNMIWDKLAFLCRRIIHMYT